MRNAQIIICITLAVFIVLIYSCVNKMPLDTAEPVSESEEDPSEDWSIEAETLEVSTQMSTSTTRVAETTDFIKPAPTTQQAEETTKLYVDMITDEVPGGYEMYFTEDDVIMVAKVIWGEAGSDWINRRDKAKVAWTVCNRVDSPRWPNSIYAVLTQRDQFHGYSPNNPVTDECYEIAKDVLIRWSLEKQGVDVYREASKSITAFYGNGYENFFYES